MLTLKENLNNEDIKSLHELIALFEEENTRLEKENQTLKATENVLQDEIENLNSEIAYKEFRLKEMEDQDHTKTTELQQFQYSIKEFRALKTLPKSLQEFLDFFAKAYPDKLVVHENAIKSAENSNYNGDLSRVWEILWHTVNTLYELYFNKKESIDIAKCFKESSGYELSLNEGKMTNHDKALCSIREIKYANNTYDITPHISYGNKPCKLLRLHFAIEKSMQKIIIGHFGDHIENRTSKTKKF